MSTREYTTRPEAGFLRPASEVAERPSACTRLSAWPPLFRLAYLGGDLLAITLAHMLAYRIAQHYFHVPTDAVNPFGYHRFYIPFFAVILYLLEGYKSPELRRPEQELERSCKAVALSFLGLVLFNFVVLRTGVFSRYMLVTWFALACLLLVALRFSLRLIHEKLWSAGLCRRRAVLVGSSAGLAEYQQLLSIQKHRGYDLVAVLVHSAKQVPAGRMPDLPTEVFLDQLENSLVGKQADVLIVAFSVGPSEEEWLTELLCRCKQLRVDVELYSPVLATANLNYDHDEFSGCFRFYAKSQWSLALQRGLKRAIDIVIGLIGSGVTLLLTPIVFALISLEERGPLFYRSAYLRQDGSTRYYMKFRTMLINADHILETDPALRSRFREQHKLIDDPRITKVGRFLRRFSLDEFPQFFSVLVGDLAFVGPRTIRQEEAVRYGSHLKKLLSVKPGLTGFWQTMGRQTTTYEERVYMDMFYVDRWSIWLDLVIIAKTFWTVLKTEGAF